MVGRRLGCLGTEYQPLAQPLGLQRMVNIENSGLGGWGAFLHLGGTVRMLNNLYWLPRSLVLEVGWGVLPSLPSLVDSQLGLTPLSPHLPIA